MWNWNLYENSAVIAEGRRRSLCACIVAMTIGGILLAILGAISPNTPGFFAVLIGGALILFMGIAGIVIMCIYYPMDCCRRGRSRNGGLRQGATNIGTSLPPTPEKPPSPSPEYIPPPSYEKAIANQEAV